MVASLLPNGEQQFIDGNGVPYAGGFVYFYIPNTLVFKNTWQNPGQTILNSNPVVLDAAGRAIIYGNGQYRQILTDSLGNTVWDQLTADVSYSASQAGFLLSSNNLSDVANTATSLANLGGAPLASPAFTGTPTAPTAALATNTTQLATTAFVLANSAPLNSPAFTGTPTAPTQTAGNNSTDLATTAYVDRGASGASMVLLGTATASNSASIAFINIPPGYDQYELRFTDAVPVSSGQSIGIQLSLTNGSSYIATNYSWQTWEVTSAGASAAKNSASDTTFNIAPSGISNSPGIGMCGTVLFTNLSGLGQTQILIDTEYFGGAVDNSNVGGGRYTGANGPFNALRILAQVGASNILAGKFSLYAIRNS